MLAASEILDEAFYVRPAIDVATSAKDATQASRQRGKLFFNTGNGRWSLRGQGWGACQSCHTDGLTDNYLRVHARRRFAPALDLRNSITGAALTAYDADGLWGEVLSVEC